jgi:hypothetical protein
MRYLKPLLLIAVGAIVGWICWNAAQYYWSEANSPMTQEKYEILCGKNVNKCAPEIGDILFAVFSGGGVIIAAVLIVRACAILWRERIRRHAN